MVYTFCVCLDCVLLYRCRELRALLGGGWFYLTFFDSVTLRLCDLGLIKGDCLRGLPWIEGGLVLGLNVVGVGSNHYVFGAVLGLVRSKDGIEVGSG